MSAILGRMVVRKDGPIVSEYLRRDETLFVEREWSWTTDRDAAYRFDFRSYEEELETIERHTEMVEERPARPWAINLPRVERKARTEPDCGQSIPPRREMAEQNFASGGVENPRHAPDVRCGHGSLLSTAQPDAGVTVRPARKSIQDRIHDSKRNRRTAAANKEALRGDPPPRRNRAPGAEAWRAIYQARVAPEDVYERTERRCGS